MFGGVANAAREVRASAWSQAPAALLIAGSLAPVGAPAGLWLVAGGEERRATPSPGAATMTLGFADAACENDGDGPSRSRLPVLRASHAR